MALDIVRVGRASLATRGLIPRFQLQTQSASQLALHNGPAGPTRSFLGLLSKCQMSIRELTGAVGLTAADMLTAAGAGLAGRTPPAMDPRSRCRPLPRRACRGACPRPCFVISAVIRGPRTRLAHTRVEAKVAHQLLRLARSVPLPIAATMAEVATTMSTP